LFMENERKRTVPLVALDRERHPFLVPHQHLGGLVVTRTEARSRESELAARERPKSDAGGRPPQGQASPRMNGWQRPSCEGPNGRVPDRNALQPH
jgi:hypothetical protein